MNRYRMTIQYDGSDFFGWQVQPRECTVQQCLEEVLARIDGMATKVHGSGRTDQGVHAAGQVAHFDLSRTIAPGDLRKALNAMLPATIRIVAVRPVADSFHARRSAIQKEYRYFIWNADCVPPFLCRYRTLVRPPLNVAAMNAAAATLQGTHDFAAFTANPNRPVPSTVRNLTLLRVTRKGREIVITARSNGFLYKMVRSLCGLLIRVGEGAVPPEFAQAILESHERTAQVPTAPPEGLFLWKVFY